MMNMMKRDAYYEKLFGTQMKGKPPHQCARIKNVSRFLDGSCWFWNTPGLQSSIFNRIGLHITIILYVCFGQLVFFLTTWGIARSDQEDVIAVSIGHALVSTSTKLLTFVLSAYLIQIISTYHKDVRSKSRRMMYGCSQAVDCISTTIDYDHENARNILSDLHRALAAIGHHALNTASGATEDIKMANFDKRGLNGKYLLSLAPKQVLHVLRLGILQTIVKERKNMNGCLSSMSNEDFMQLRRELNDYCGGASSTSSSSSSSKLPYCYFQLVNWAVKVLSLFYTATYYCVEAKNLADAGICMRWLDGFCDLDDRPPDRMTVAWNLFFNVFHCAILYFLFGILECYRSVNQIWENGLVLDNYHGIIDLICQPLANTDEAPMDVAQLSLETRSRESVLGNTSVAHSYTHVGSITGLLINGNATASTQRT